MKNLNTLNSQYFKIKFADDLKKVLDTDWGFPLVNILNDYLYAASSKKYNITKDIWSDNSIRNEIIEHMITKLMNTNGYNEKENSIPIHDLGVYTTGEVAKYMGISVQTVNEWIKSGKITPAHRTNGETGQWRIPVNAKVILRNGSSYSLKDVIQEKEQISKGSEYATRDEELSSIMEELAFYQRKYPNYFELLYNTNRTAEEERDLKLWLYWQQRYAAMSFGEVAMC